MKKFSKKEDPYEADPFDKDAFRRHSAMLPDTFDDEVDGSPEMTEHHNVGGSPNMYEYHDPSIAGMAGMGVMAAGAGVAAGSALSHNESGGPRPPTMFQKHLNAYDANAAYSQAPPVPAIPGAGYETNYPQLPPFAFGGGDPYGAAGVAPMSNVSNPYAHLDRARSDGSNSGDGAHGAAGAQQYHQQQQYDTAGRPGTSEGRSGTPDLPNMQHTYAAGAGFDDEDTRFPAFNSPQAEPVRNPFDNNSTHAHQQNGSLGSNGSYGTATNFGMVNTSGGDMHHSPPHNPHVVQGLQTNLHPQPSLSVRNLMPSGGYQQQQQRPISTVSSAADPDDAYGGVY